MNIMERKNTDLIKEFNRYIREHPEFADSIPDNAIVIMQLKGDEAFNKWALDLAKSHAEKGKDLTGILCSNQRHLLEDPDGAQGDVLEVADGGCHDIQYASPQLLMFLI